MTLNLSFSLFFSFEDGLVFREEATMFDLRTFLSGLDKALFFLIFINRSFPNP
jgi:hypothetical protein